MEFTEDELEKMLAIFLLIIQACDARLRNKVASTNCQSLDLEDLKLETSLDEDIPCVLALFITAIMQKSDSTVILEERNAEVYQKWLAIAKSELGNG